MEKIKSFFSRFKDEKGFGILGLLTVLGLISVAVGLHSLGEYSKGAREEVQKPFITVQNLPDAGEDNVDSGKEYLKGKKALVDAFKKCVEDGISLGVDDTAGLGILKETGVFDIPKDKKKEQEDSDSNKDDAIFIKGLVGAIKGPAGDTDLFAIEEKLDENNLPTDAITQDITKIVINVANQAGSSDSEIADIIDTSIDVIKDLTNKDKNKGIDNDSSKTLDIVKEKLNEINKLEDEEIINKRKEHNLSVLEKEQLEKEIEVYEHYKDTDNIIISDEIYIKIQQRLDYLNDKIDALENELKEYQEKSEEYSEDQDLEDISTDEETQGTSTDEEEPEVIIEGTKEAPTIKLYVINLDTTSKPWIAIYTVQAVVTGEPTPITNFDDSELGNYTTEVFVKSYSGENHDGKVTITGVAINSEGRAEHSIILVWEDVWSDNSEE